MVDELQQQLNGIHVLLLQLSDDIYNAPIGILKGSSIGAHVRHVAEFVKCLHEQYDSGLINYDLRTRDRQIEKDVLLARSVLSELMGTLNKPDKLLQVNYTNFEGGRQQCSTSYFRELLYNVEHCIHHEALIRVALSQLHLSALVDETFGVAPSTLRAMSFSK